MVLKNRQEAVLFRSVLLPTPSSFSACFLLVLFDGKPLHIHRMISAVALEWNLVVDLPTRAWAVGYSAHVESDSTLVDP